MRGKKKASLKIIVSEEKYLTNAFSVFIAELFCG